MAQSIPDEICESSETAPLLSDPDKSIDRNDIVLSSLERDADTMKDFLAHLQNESAIRSRSSSVKSLGSDQNSNNLDISPQVCNVHDDGSWSTYETTSHPIESQIGINNAYKPTVQDMQMMLQELNNERVRILNGIENEEKERQWYLDQIDKIKSQQHSLPVMDNYPIQNDLMRQKLEEEAQQLQDAMQKKLGSSSDMMKRHESRMQSLQFIDREAIKLKEQTDMVLGKRHHESKKAEPKSRQASDETNNGSLETSSDHTIGPDALRNNKMITSGTQTSVNFFGNECSNNDQMAMNESTMSPSFMDSWPLDKVNLWHSGPTTFGEMGANTFGFATNAETASVMSFTSSMNSVTSRRSTHQLGAKVEMVYSLISMLGTHNKDEMSQTLLTMSLSRECCIAMRQSGCMPLLIQFLHSDTKDSGGDGINSSRETRSRASKALHNIVHAHPEDKQGKRETRVLRLLEQIRDYSDALRDSPEFNIEDAADISAIANTEQHPGPSMAALMKLSFDEEHRHTMCQLGGLQAIAELIEIDHLAHGNTSDNYCVTLRRYAGMALTNLTFGDGTNKALLCSLRSFMQALVAQLQSPSEDLRQVFASVLRNLSWRADSSSKEILREVGAVVTLMKAAMEAKKESTLKSILSALWNLSAHCSMNKADICAVDGALAFLVGTLTYKSASKTLAINENGGGILRNISSQIAVREDYRAVLRQHNCLQILLQHLRSSSLTIVSNACGTLWNLSARSLSDQQLLWEMGAVGMLRNLVHSKHKMISMGSSAALKNLLAAKPQGLHMNMGSNSIDGNKTNVPSLHVRKQRALEAEIDQTLSETCDNIDSPKSSPTHRLDSEHRFSTDETNGHYPVFNRMMLHGRMYRSFGDHVPPHSKHVCRSDSRDSINSTHSDTSHDRIHPCGLRYRPDKYPTVIPEVVESLGGKSEFENMNTAKGLGEMSADTYKLTQIMKEVVQQIALEDSVNNCVSTSTNDSMANQKNLTESVLVNQLSKTLNSNQMQTGGSNLHSYNKYRNFSDTDIDNLNLVDQSKCNGKYSCRDNEQMQDNASFEKLPTKVNNYVHEKTMKQNADVDFQASAKHCTNHWEGMNYSSGFANKSYVKSCNISEEKLNYGTYAETDLDNLDQPTNYSLRYVEDDEPSSVIPAFQGYSEGEDTMRTYCTEDTPLNFSSATSMLDLHETPEKDKLNHSDEKNLDEGKNLKCDFYHAKNKKEENGNSQMKDINLDMQERSVTSEKPTTYCMEGTPVCFSRVSSLSSLHSTDVNDNLNANTVTMDADCESKEICHTHHNEKTAHKSAESTMLMSDTKIEVHQEMKPTEKTSNYREVTGKTVSFGEENFAEETPLMFSRSSSLGSLSSFDQHSIHDDRSSVISDFSRRASGLVSPSDLPDSPSQTMPSSPKHNKSNAHFPEKNVDKPLSMFEDEMQVFAIEDTPIQFSSATSLSSLIIEDDITTKGDGASSSQSDSNIIKNNLHDSEREEKRLLETNEKNLGMDMKNQPQSKIKNDEDDDLSETEENEDEILAACINSGMPNNSKQNRRKCNNSKLLSKVNKFNGPPRTSGIPIKTNNVRIIRPPLNAAASLTPSHQYSSLHMNNRPMESNLNVNLDEASQEMNSLCLAQRQYNHCEGKQKHDLNNGNDANSDACSVDDDFLLQQVIQSGMPKQKYSKRKLNNDMGGSSGQKVSNLGIQKKLANSSSSVPEQSYETQIKKKSEDIHRDLLPSNLRHYNACGSYNKNAPESVRSKTPINSHYEIHENELLAAQDCVHQFAEEGTPVGMSSRDSLSSLSCDDESVTSQRQKHTSKRHLKDSLLFKIGKNSVTNSVNNLCQQKESTKTEDQSYLSKHSTLSKECYKDRSSHINENNYTVTSEYASNNCVEQHQQFHMEDTPVCFSRNSSLSSLSLESLGLEASEQALLEDCINLGMPKPKNNTSSKKWKNKNSAGKSNQQDANKEKEYESNLSLQYENSNIPETVEQFQRNSLMSEISVDEDADSVSSNVDVTISAPSSSNECTEMPSDCQSGCSKETAVTIKNDLSANISEKINNTFSDLDASPSADDIPLFVEEFKLDKTPEPTKYIETEACKLAQHIQIEVENLPDFMNQSVESVYSDLENINPPSQLGNVLSLTCSMASSCASESVSDMPPETERKQTCTDTIVPLRSVNSAKVNEQKLKNVPELVIRALSGSNVADAFDAALGNSLLENGNIRSSSGELIDNVKPPSILEDIDLTSSTYSVASITSEIAEFKSENLSLKGSMNSDILFECIKPVIAMAELYAREGIVASSMKNSCTSEYIENINPPSVLQELTECNYSTTQDVSATLGSDTDTENELPEDTTTNLMQYYEHTQASAVKSDNDVHKRTKNEKYLNVEGVDNIMNNITAEEVRTIQADANLIASTLIAMKQNMSNESSLIEDNLLECETLSLVSDDSESSEAESEHADENIEPTCQAPKGPRIIKPGDERVQKQEEDIDPNNAPKAIRGKRRGLTRFRRPQQTITPEQTARNASPPTKVNATGVKPTRTSALRASQTQQKGNTPTRVIDSSTITKKKNVRPVNSTEPTKTNSSNLRRNETFKKEDRPDMSPKNNDDGDIRPKPPIKQGTFTKEKPAQDPKAKRTTTTGHVNKPPTPKTMKPSGGKENTASPLKSKPLKSRMLQSRSLDDRIPSNNVSNQSSRSPSSGSQTRNGSRRIQSPSPMNRKVSNSLNNLKKGNNNVATLKNSSSNQSLGRNSLSGVRTPNSGLNSRSGSGTLTSNKRSSSNTSICSNNSSNTTASTVTTASNKKVAPSYLKKEATSKIAALWKKSDDKTPKGRVKPENAVSTGKANCLPRSSTYETIPTVAHLADKDKQMGIRLEDKNQVNNKTFTKSPSVDAKLDGLLDAGAVDAFQGRENTTRPQKLFSSRETGNSNQAHSGNIISPKTANQSGKSLIPTPTRSHPPSGKPKDGFTSTVDSCTSEEPKRNTCIITAV